MKKFHLVLAIHNFRRPVTTAATIFRYASRVRTPAHAAASSWFTCIQQSIAMPLVYFFAAAATKAAFSYHQADDAYDQSAAAVRALQ